MTRKKDQSGKLLALIILLSIASAVWQWMKATSTVAWTWVAEHWIALSAVACALLFLRIWFVVASKKAETRRRKNRQKALSDKYGDDAIAQGIMNGEFWIGATEEMLRDSIGEPDDKDFEVMKRKTKETWKYGHKQANQYRLRIYMENGCVTRWEQKT